MGKRWVINGNYPKGPFFLGDLGHDLTGKSHVLFKD